MFFEDADGNSMLSSFQECTSEEQHSFSQFGNIEMKTCIAKLKGVFDVWEKEREQYKTAEKKSAKEVSSAEALIDKTNAKYDKATKDLEVAEAHMGKLTGSPTSKENAKLQAAKDKSQRDR
jgi:hypothetical protein